jgi:1-acyl-sn-glycerol-3-phosphate acyltransferase
VKPRKLLAAALRLPPRLVYTAWTLLLFVLVGLVSLLLLVLLPRMMLRRAAARAAARCFLTLAGMPLEVRFAERLPPGQCVVVCNHASYIDGIVLTAALPARFGFVIKREMARVPLAGALLRRLGSEFVERFDRARGATDARRVLRNAIHGHSLVFFPEGTFTRSPGLLKFHSGAFATAARAGCPLVPAVVRGTRRALAPGGAWSRPGALELEILPPLEPGAAPVDQATSLLRERARAAMLTALGEPDLTCCGDTGRPPGTAPAKSVPASRP